MIDRSIALLQALKQDLARTSNAEVQAINEGIRAIQRLRELETSNKRLREAAARTVHVLTDWNCSDDELNKVRDQLRAALAEGEGE